MVVLEDIISSFSKLIDVDTETSVAQCLALMKENGITSLPVYGVPGRWIGAGMKELIVNDKQYIGIVSNLDISAFIIEYLEKNCSSMEDFAKVLEKCLNQHVLQAIGETNESRSLWAESSKAPLQRSMEEFSKGVHRVLVFDETTKNVKMISQYDVLRTLFELKGTIGKSLKECDITSLPLQDIDTLSSNDSFLLALLKLKTTGRIALPIVDANGRVISQVSSSDLQNLIDVLPGLQSMSTMNLMTFLTETSSTKAPPTPLTITLDDSFDQAIKIMIEFHVHRLWVVESQDSPVIVNVFSLTDAIHFYYKNLVQLNQ